MKIRKYIHKNPFDVAREEKAKKYNPGFRFEPYTQKRKLRSHGNLPSKHLKHLQMTSNSK